MHIAQLQQQNDVGFRRLRFSPELEPHYRRVRDKGIRERARPVCASALALFLLYALLDTLMLPASIAHDTVLVRLLVTCPVIAGVWWLSYSTLSPATFVRLYGLAYLIGSLSVVVIIALARLNHQPLPYEGILLMLMFGYFVMGLPFRRVSIISLIMIVAYLFAEHATGLEGQQLLIHGFFIGTANVIGMVGSWLSEHRQRAHFLDRQMLELSRTQAEQESQRKTRLITVASHDLRQPLNVISLILEHLDGDPLPPQPASLVTRLKTSVAHFNGLLGSILDISRIQEGMIAPEPQPLNTRLTLEQIIETCGEEARERGVTLTLSPETKAANIAVLADPQLLYRILQNLVVNALEHSGATRIELHARYQSGQGQVRVDVSDNGRGMDPAGAAQAFDPFYRHHSGPTSRPGLGLGLAIVRELSSLMDGQCGVTSAPGYGCCFWIELPASAITPQVHADTGPALTSNTEAPHFLVVEDHDEARHWVGATLKRWGYNNDCFASAEEVLAPLCNPLQGAPYILVTDLHLPGLSGPALFSQLRERGVVSGGILMTADTALPEGYDHTQRLWVMHKPLAPMRLRAAIQQVIRHGSNGSDQAQ